MKDFSAFLQKQCEKYKSEANDKISLAMVCSSLGQLLFYRCVRTVTHHLLRKTKEPLFQVQCTGNKILCQDDLR